MKSDYGTTVDKNIMIRSQYPINTDISNLIIQLRDASLSKVIKHFKSYQKQGRSFFYKYEAKFLRRKQKKKGEKLENSPKTQQKQLI